MSNKKNNESIFSNEDTLVRRAWIDSALDSVRSHLSSGTSESETTSVASGDAASAHPEVSSQSSKPVVRSQPQERPNLYLAWSANERRSGT
jgi:hypothetical protein